MIGKRCQDILGETRTQSNIISSKISGDRLTLSEIGLVDQGSIQEVVQDMFAIFFASPSSHHASFEGVGRRDICHEVLTI